MVGLLNRKRKFSYKSHSNDFMYNLSGKKRKQLETLKAVGRQALNVGGTALGAAAVLVKAIGVGKTACAAAGAGLPCREDVREQISYACEDIGDAISDACYRIEPCVQGDEGYSVPTRKGLVTGRYHH